MHNRRFGAERLVDGLNHEERLARLETKVLGNDHVPGLDVDHDKLLERVEGLEHRENRQAMPFFLRWFLPKTPDTRPWKERKRA